MIRRKLLCLLKRLILFACASATWHAAQFQRCSKPHISNDFSKRKNLQAERLLRRLQNYGHVEIESICRRRFLVAHIVRFFFDRVENKPGKRGNTGYQHFLFFFLAMLSKLLAPKSGLCG